MFSLFILGPSRDYTSSLIKMFGKFDVTASCNPSRVCTMRHTLDGNAVIIRTSGLGRGN